METIAPAGGDTSAPVVEEGPISEVDQQAAEDLLAQAEASFEGRRFLEVLRLTGDLVDRYPASSVSGAAVLLTARAEYGAGSPERADAAAERYLSLLPEGDGRAATARLLQVEVLEGQPLIQLDRLMRIDDAADPADVARARSLVSEMVDGLSAEELEIVAEGAPRGGVAAGPLYAMLSAELLARGENDRAADYAGAAIASGVSGEDLALAESVMRGELPESMRPERTFEIATVLPLTGPPALAEYATLVAEGIEVAVATLLGPEFDVTVVPLDDAADPVVAAQVAEELETRGVAGAIGFLTDDGLVAAATARRTGLPIVSPTARSVDRAGLGAYSLGGPDPRAAQAVALHSVARAHQRVAMIYPDTPDASREADAFQAVAQRFGIPIVGRFTYPEGATDFDAQFQMAQDSLRAAEVAALGLTEADSLVSVADLVVPVGLFMPIPAEDVEFVAPQFAHFGLDTLAVEIVGTSGWTDPQALEQVDPRLVSGVVATAPVGAGPGSSGYARFRQAYEAYFQRSLVSPTPAIGYDAAQLLIEALRPGRLRPTDVLRAFSELEAVEGATGLFSVVEDRIVRRTEVVRIENGTVVPIPVPQFAPAAGR